MNNPHFRPVACDAFCRLAIPMKFAILSETTTPYACSPFRATDAMSPSNRRMPLFCSPSLPGLLAAAFLALTAPARAAPVLPDPCKLITVVEMQQIVGPLKGPPEGTDPKSGEISCGFAPSRGPSFVDIALHDGDLSAWRKRNGGVNPLPLPEFGSDAFVNPDFNNWADLYAKKGSLVLRVTMPKGPHSIEAVKAIARKALARM